MILYYNILTNNNIKKYISNTMYTWDEQLLINEQDLYTIKSTEQDGNKKRIASKQILKGRELWYAFKMEITWPNVEITNGRGNTST